VGPSQYSNFQHKIQTKFGSNPGFWTGGWVLEKTRME